jgi:photosystem II stability/assembly factor-like uncharacterized protein
LKSVISKLIIILITIYNSGEFEPYINIRPIRTLSAKLCMKEFPMKLLSGSFMIGLMAITQVQAAWVKVTGNLAGQASACGNIYYIAAVPQKDKIIVSVCGNKGLWATTDNGASWHALGSASTWVDPNSILFDKDNPDVFWEIGMHGGGAYKTTDGGATFSALGQGNGDGIGVDFTDPLRKTIVIGAHETTRVAKSTDGGTTWTDITAGLTGSTSYLIVIDANTFVLSSINGGIFRTTNGGTTWTKVSPYFATWTLLQASDGAYYGVVMGNQAIIKSTDQGQTWSQKAKPGVNIYSPMFTPVEMPDHSIVAIGANTLTRSTNGGTSWSAIGDPFPSPAGLGLQGIAYNSISQSFFLTYTDCNSTVPANAIWRLSYSTGTTNGNNALKAGAPSWSKNTILMTGSLSRVKPGNRAAIFDLYGRRVQPMKRSADGIVIARFRK